MQPLRTLASATLLLAVLAVPADAGKVEKSFPFKLDEWFTLDVTDGPVTLHRIRLEHKEGNFKSKIFRPTNTEFLESVQIQIDYTNTASRDYEAELDIVWVDSAGREIDGYRDEEDIDEEESDTITVLLSTLKYGLERAETLKVKIEF